jgi:probable HAF family extracellular repeat protein
MAKLCAVHGILIMLLSAATAPVHAAVQYTVTDLGEFSPKAINNQGEVVGGGATGEAALWSNGITTYLGTLGNSQSYAADINDLGQIVGESNATDGNIHAFLYSKGSMNDLGNFGGKWGSADAINNSGQMAINVSTQVGGIQAYQYTSGSLTNLGNLGGDTTVAHGINSNGDIVGYSTTDDGSMHAFITYNNQQMTDLNIPGGHAEAESINDAGQIIGTYYVSDYVEHAFVYSNGTFSDINGDKDFSTATGINNLGEIVGMSWDGHTQFPFVYQNETMYGLNDLIVSDIGTTLWGAFSINNSGQIVVAGMNGHGYLLTPIPEPSTLTIFISIFIGICIHKMTRKTYCKIN